MTAAHRSLPFGTEVRVTRIETGESVVVRINDRGPFKAGRIIDLSKRAARELGIVQVGLAEVTVRPVGAGPASDESSSEGRTSTGW
jgi:rare lipoprotein A